MNKADADNDLINGGCCGLDGQVSWATTNPKQVMLILGKTEASNPKP